MEYPVRTAEQLTHIIRGIRREKRLTQQDVGDQIGLKQEAISTLERNPESVSIARLLSVFAALGVEVIIRDLPTVKDDSKGQW